MMGGGGDGGLGWEAGRSEVDESLSGGHGWRLEIGMDLDEERDEMGKKGGEME
jgi:hypothetical protein